MSWAWIPCVVAALLLWPFLILLWDRDDRG